jgi:hypothetical protein
MFDRYVTERRYVTHNSNSTVTEKKAPTDASIALYKELVEKAVDSVVSTFKVNSTELEVQGFVSHDMQSLLPRVIIVYRLNRQAERRFEYEVHLGTTPRNLIDMLAVHLATSILLPMLEGDRSFTESMRCAFDEANGGVR